MAQRTCARCGTTPDVTPFKRDKRASDGYGAYCLPCQRAYNAEHYAANRERRNTETAAYYRTNRDRVLAQQAEYRAAHIERIREYDRARYHADPVRRSAHVAVWVATNRERLLASRQAYYRTNRDRIRDAEDYRRVDRAGFGAACEPIIRREVWEAWGCCCGICSEPVAWAEMELDHIQPISRGGSHTWDNVQPAHKPCNSGKRDREEHGNGHDRPTPRDQRGRNVSHEHGDRAGAAG